MTSREPVVCFAGDNYWFSNPHSRYHLMHAMHRRGHRILWVNSVGMNMPKVRRSGFLKRVVLKLRSWARWLGRAEEGFHVLTPIALPLFGNRAFEAFNNRWIGAQVKLACGILGLKRPLVFASIPTFAGVVAGMDRSGLIYYYSDKYDAYRDITAKSSIEAMDRRLFEDADCVFCAAERVHESLRGDRDHVEYLPHAVDFRHFNRALDSDVPEPADQKAIPHPRVGYFGSITDSNDQDMILHAARHAPDLQFVMIGRVLGDYGRLADLPNVHMLGFKSYADLPGYAKRWDAAFMCWKMTEWIRHSNPLKTKEYLSMGLPVASVEIDELVNSYAEFVEFASDGPELLAALRRCLADDSPQRRADRIAAVAGESWDARVEGMMAVYEAATSEGEAEPCRS